MRSPWRAGGGDMAASPVPDEAAGAPHSLAAELPRALAALPRDTAQILHWRLLDQLSFEGIAQHLQVPLNTVKTRYYRGMDQLRLKMRPVYEEGLR